MLDVQKFLSKTLVPYSVACYLNPHIIQNQHISYQMTWSDTQLLYQVVIAIEKQIS